MANRCGCDHGSWTEDDLRALCTELHCGCSYDSNKIIDQFEKEREDYNRRVAAEGTGDI